MRSLPRVAWFAKPGYARYYVAGGAFPVGLLSLRLLTMYFLSQARPLGGLHRKVGARRIDRRISSRVMFPHSPLRTVHATFTAHGSPGIGDFPIRWSPAFVHHSVPENWDSFGLHQMICDY